MPDYQLSLAIGKEGQNARLAARLTGWRVDIKSETQLAEEEAYAERGVGRGRVGRRTRRPASWCGSRPRAARPCRPSEWQDVAVDATPAADRPAADAELTTAIEVESDEIGEAELLAEAASEAEDPAAEVEAADDAVEAESTAAERAARSAPASAAAGAGRPTPLVRVVADRTDGVAGRAVHCPAGERGCAPASPSCLDQAARRGCVRTSASGAGRDAMPSALVLERWADIGPDMRD